MFRLSRLEGNCSVQTEFEASVNHDHRSLFFARGDINISQRQIYDRQGNGYLSSPGLEANFDGPVSGLCPGLLEALVTRGTRYYFGLRRREDWSCLTSVG